MLQQCIAILLPLTVHSLQAVSDGVVQATGLVRQSGSDHHALDFYCSVPCCLQLAVSSGCQGARIHTFYTHIGRYATVSEVAAGGTQPP